MPVYKVKVTQWRRDVSWVTVTTDANTRPEIAAEAKKQVEADITSDSPQLAWSTEECESPQVLSVEVVDGTENDPVRPHREEGDR